MGDAADDYFNNSFEASFMKNDDYVHALCEYKTSTKDAILIAQNNEEYWIPLSVCGWQTERSTSSWKRGQEISITLRMWFADQKGIEYDY